MVKIGKRRLMRRIKRNSSRKRGTVLASVSFLALTGTAALALYLLFTILNLPSPDQLATRQVNQSTKLYDRTGTVLLYEIHGEEKRTVVPFETIPDFVKQATLAAEDAGFYQGPAFDWKAIARAIVNNLKAWRITQGGSTITQQLAKNVFLSPEKTFSRKIKELILAIQLEARYTKDEIFSFYLNQIPYGSNAYGVEAASKTYLNKSVKDLSLAEAAALASMLKAPTYYSPWGGNKKELLARKDYILDRMAELRFISGEEKEKAKQEKLDFAPPSLGAIQAPHFSLAVRDLLIKQFGENLVMNGGLKVITTLDWKLQQFAEKATLDGADRNRELYSGYNAALVVQDPKTGQILALVGSKDYFGDPEPAGCAPGVNCKFEGNFNVATQGLRQPGSALKPFVYLTAFQKGYSPKTTVFDVSTEFDVRDDPKTSYRPVDFDGMYRGPVAFENALAQSLNIPAVKVLYLAGFDNALENLHKFGITTLQERWRYGLSLTLGGGEVQLIDLTNAYATMSQDGIKHEQSFILNVTDQKGNVLSEYVDKNKRVSDPQYPRLISQILSDPQLREPIFQNSLSLTIFPGYEVALKTGTTEDYRDAWAVGYTPALTVGVWSGNNDNAQMIRRGGSILAAVPIWSSFLKQALPFFPQEAFTKAEPIQIPNKPMLNGQSEIAPIIQGRRYLQIHSILYYVDKSNPLGPIPQNPAQDSQFQNWENGVTEWARLHIPNFYEYNVPIAGIVDLNAIPLSRQPITITNIKPSNGDFVTPPLVLQADIYAQEELKEVELEINRKIVQDLGVNGTFYRLQYSIGALENPQNLIVIRARGESGTESEVSIVLFR